MIISRSPTGHGTPPVRTAFVAVSQSPLIFSASIAAGLAAAIALWAIMPNRYVAEAVVALDARKVQVITIDSVVSRLPQDSPVLRTELDLIASRSMAQRVADHLKLIPSKETEDPPKIGLLAQFLNWLKPSAPADRSPEVLTIDRLVSGLRVNNDGRSFTIFIDFESTDPAFAKRVANAYAEAYLNHQISLQTEATRRASDWLGSKVEELGEKLQASETIVENFRRESGLVETKGETAGAQRLAGANLELAAVRSQRAGAEARLAAAEELRRSGSDSAAFSEALAYAPIQALRSREAEIGRGIGEIEASGAAMSSELPARRIQLAAVRQQIGGEVERVVAGLANEVEVARRKERAIEESVRRLEADVARTSEARVELNRLEREAAANRTIYESFLNRYKQTIEQQGLASPDATLLSRAEQPARPASPKLLPALAFGAIAGAVGGAGLAALKRRPGSKDEAPGEGGPRGLAIDGVANDPGPTHQQRRA